MLFRSLDLILDTCERTVLMSDGRIVRDGRTEEILTDQGLLEEHGLELPLCMQKSDSNGKTKGFLKMLDSGGEE